MTSTTDALPTEAPPVQSPGLLNVVKYRWLNIGFSLLLLIPGLVFIALSMINTPNHAPLRLGIDFTGGTILEYGFAKPLQQSDLEIVREIFEQRGYAHPVVQLKMAPKAQNEATLPTQPSVKPVDRELEARDLRAVVSIRTRELKGDDAVWLQAQLKSKFGPMTLLQKNLIGPSVASEILTNGVIALGLAYVLIVGYLTFRFQFDFAVCAIIALVHDAIFVIGVFSMLGYLFHTEIDSLFITGLLTVIGFSVHDTIVVFDRIRENMRVLHRYKLPFADIVNTSIKQTLARSINTSLSALLPLLALYFFGGETTHDFVLVMVIGIAIGTYSSIAIASLFLAWWREKEMPAAAAAQTVVV